MISTPCRHLRFAGIAAILMLPTLASCVIDRSIIVEPGERRGATRIIDGDFELAPRARVDRVRVIDGDIRLREDSVIHGDAHITDGNLIMRPGAVIHGTVVAHHAELELDGARIDGDIELFCSGGAITASRIDAVVRVRKRALWHVSCAGPKKLFIGPGSDIRILVVETPDIDIEISAAAIVRETRRD